VKQRQQSVRGQDPALGYFLAVAIFLAGAVRYYLPGNSPWRRQDIAWCRSRFVLALLIFDYTLHHATKVAAVWADLRRAV